MASLSQLPVEVLLLMENWAKVDYDFTEVPPSLLLSWVCKQLRAVFMPRFWSFVTLDDTESLERTVNLIKSSPADTYRSLAKYVRFGGGIGAALRLDPRLYTMDPTPSIDDQLSAGEVPSRATGDNSIMCGPRIEETWPTPTQLIFNDPKRYFKLAGRKTAPDAADESDETGSSAASEEEEEERKCTECHPVLHKSYRHRVKPDDYWLPGAVHSIGPLQWDRRTWGSYRGLGRKRESGFVDIEGSFFSSTMFIMEQLDFEALEWAAAFPIPRLLCEKLAQHPCFYKLGTRGIRGGKDCYSSLLSRDALLLLAPKITVLQEIDGTIFGAREILLDEDANGAEVPLPLSDYSEVSSMQGFMEFLLAARELKHLSTDCKGVFVTPCLLGVFAKLHSLHWGTVTSEPDEHVLALSKLRASLWNLAQAVGRPNHLLQAADVQLLADSAGEHAELAAELAPLADWLEQEELAALVAQGWNEQEERGSNEDALFHPPYTTDFMLSIVCSSLTSAYEDPTSQHRD